MAGMPEQIGPFEVVGEIGRGGMGVVYLARQPSIGRMVAVKVLPFRDERLAERLRQEATILGEMQHPHIVSVLDVGIDDGYPYYAMAYCAGGSLAQVLDRDGRLSPGKTATALSAVSDALAAMHARGLVHRDVKPSNVLLSSDGEPFLADFGLAMGEGGQRVTTSGAVLGTIGYAAPELLDGHEVTGTADTFSLGVLGYQLLAGEPPFNGAHVTAVIEAVRTGRCRPLSEVRPDAPAALVACVERAMATDPLARPADLREFAGELRSSTAPERIIAVQAPAEAGITIASNRRSGSGNNSATKPIARTDGQKGWKRPRVLVSAVSGLGVCTVALGLAFAGVFGGSPKSGAATVGYQLPTLKFDNGVVVSESWALTGADGNTMRSTTQVRNPGDATVMQPVDIVIPKALAKSVDDVTLSPRPDIVVKRDPIVRYCLRLRPGAKRVLHYSVSASGARSPSSRLTALATEWDTASAANNAMPSGTMCKGVSTTAAPPTVDSSNAGVVASPGSTDVALGTAPTASTTAGSGTRASSGAQPTPSSTGRTTGATTAPVTQPRGATSATSAPVTQPPAAQPTAAPATQAPVANPVPATPPTVTQAAPVRNVADINGDGVVGCKDYAILQSQFNQKGSGLSGDLNKDGVVDVFDLSIYATNYQGDGTGPGNGAC